MSLAALTSNLGSAVKDTLIVLPIPLDNILYNPIEDVINPLKSVPASVIPTWSG